MTEWDVCCPICWAMPDKSCHGPFGTHAQRVELAEAPFDRAAVPHEMFLARPLTSKVVEHPEFEHGRRDALANRKHVGAGNPAWNWKTVASIAYGCGHSVGRWQRHTASGLPHLLGGPGYACTHTPRHAVHGGFGRELLVETADALARCDGDRARAGLDSMYGAYLTDQYFDYVAHWLPLVPLLPEPPPPDRTYQPSLESEMYRART